MTKHTRALVAGLLMGTLLGAPLAAAQAPMAPNGQTEFNATGRQVYVFNDGVSITQDLVVGQGLTSQAAATFNSTVLVNGVSTFAGNVVLSPLPTGTAATYACFTSGGQLISSAAAC